MRKLLNDTGGSIERDGDTLRLVSDDPNSLDRVHDQLRDRHTRAVARRLLLSGAETGSTSFMFNRQAAAAGVVALCGSEAESPLGPIYAKLDSAKVMGVIDWLTAYESG